MIMTEPNWPLVSKDYEAYASFSDHLYNLSIDLMLGGMKHEDISLAMFDQAIAVMLSKDTSHIEVSNVLLRLSEQKREKAFANDER